MYSIRRLKEDEMLIKGRDIYFVDDIPNVVNGLGGYEAFRIGVPVYRITAQPAEAKPGEEVASVDDRREKLGRRVREVWIAWAKRQPNPKASWLAPYDELSEADKEADRCIGSALWGDFVAEYTEQLAPASVESAPIKFHGTAYSGIPTLEQANEAIAFWDSLPGLVFGFTDPQTYKPAAWFQIIDGKLTVGGNHDEAAKRVGEEAARIYEQRMELHRLGLDASESVQTVNIVRHEVEQLRIAIRRLRANLSSMEDERDRAIAERDKLREELAGEKAESQLLRNSLSDALERQPPYDEQVIELTKQLEAARAELAIANQTGNELAAQLAASKAAANTELLAACKEIQAAFEYDGGRLVGRLYQAKNQLDEAVKKAEQPTKEPQDDWRELSKGDTYSGPGQVRDSINNNWMDAIILGVDDLPALKFPFVAKLPGQRHDVYQFARVRAAKEVAND